MRTPYLLAASLLASFSARAQALPALPPDQTRVECLYRLTYKPDSTATATRTETMRLQIGSKVSRFESLSALRGDSVMKAVFLAAESEAKATGATPTIKMDAQTAQLYRTIFRGQYIYKVATAQQVTVYDQIGTTHYVYQEPSAAAWAITPATATVAGYACQRATAAFGGRTWEAWFTREVPIPEGPYKFYGLPGLIVKAGDTRGQFTYELVKLQRLASPVPMSLPDAGSKPIAKEEFTKGKAEYSRNALERMMASGNIRFNTPEEEEKAKQRSREKAKRPTNPIELK